MAIEVDTKNWLYKEKNSPVLNVDKNIIWNNFYYVFNIFSNNEIFEVLNNAHERSLCGSLAMRLNNEIIKYNNYYVDIEYNRQFGQKIKTTYTENMEYVNITCDIIVHSRGYYENGDNLIAIEVKKIPNSSANELNKDRTRLKALTSKYGVFPGGADPEYVAGYIMGVFVIIDYNARSFILERYEDGMHFMSYKIPFNDQILEGTNLLENLKPA